MKITITLSEVLDKCNNWNTFCNNEWYCERVVNEWWWDVEIDLSVEKAKKYWLIQWD